MKRALTLLALLLVLNCTSYADDMKVLNYGHKYRDNSGWVTAFVTIKNNLNKRASDFNMVYTLLDEDRSEIAVILPSVCRTIGKNEVKTFSGGTYIPMDEYKSVRYVGIHAWGEINTIETDFVDKIFPVKKE